MRPRLVGGLILVLALLAALVVPRLLDPPVVDGSADVAPPAPPPVVGACLSDTGPAVRVGPDGEVVADGAVTSVGCDEPHAGEVVQLESDPPAATDASPDAALTALNVRCSEENYPAWRDAPGPAAGWSPDLVITFAVIAPSQRQRDSGQRWRGCVLGVQNSVLDRPLAQIDAVALPAALGSCISAAGVTAGTSNGTDCTTPHVAETFGRRVLAVGDDLTQDELVGGCTELVTRATGRTGVATDPALGLATTAYATYDGRDAEVVELPLPADATGGWATCGIHAADGRELTASLRQIGDAPLPWAG